MPQAPQYLRLCGGGPSTHLNVYNSSYYRTSMPRVKKNRARKKPKKHKNKKKRDNQEPKNAETGKKTGKNQVVYVFRFSHKPKICRWV